jgi:uncharacterized protein
MRRSLFLILLGAGIAGASFSWAGETLPPPPSQYVTDTTGDIPAPLIAQLNQRLAAFERQTSNQIVAVVGRSLPTGTTLEDYAQSLYHAWKIGSKKNSNGVLILVFTQDRKIRIQPGYGLEGALPDALCSRIIRETMAPAFRSGNYAAGLSAGINAVMQATKGEYKGNGRTGAHSSLMDLLFSPLGFFLFVFLLLMIVSRSRRDLGPGGVNPGAAAATGFLIGGLGGLGGGSGGVGGDSGGFSGGGGDSGGGGSSGDW